MSKIARELGTVLLPYIVEYASGVDFAKRMELRRGIEEEFDRYLAPTFALLDRLAALLKQEHPFPPHLHNEKCSRCQTLTDCEAHKKERG